MATHPRRRILVQIGLGFVFAAALALGLIGAARLTRDGYTPGDELADDHVVASLQASGTAYSEALRADLRRARANPDDPELAKRAARSLIGEGRAAGDTRLVGAGLGILRPALLMRDAEALTLAATARQHQHDFAGALALLDEAIALAPNDVNAVLTRATIRTVVGEFDRAQEDCRRLGGLRRIDLALLCQAAAVSLTEAAPEIYARLVRIIEAGGIFGPELEVYARGLLGEIAMQQGWRDVARRDFTAVLASDPAALRVRMMLADLLLGMGDAAAAMDALKGAPAVDGVLLRRAIAAAALGDEDAAGAAGRELGRRVRLNGALGLDAHAREEARYYLEVAPDAALALDRAQANWDLQRELEDAQLLIDAAMAAGRPAAAAGVVAWINESAISVPTLRVPDAVLEAAR